MASPSDPPTGRAGDTEQFPVARTGAHAAQPSDAAPDSAPADGPAHAVGSDSGSGITRGGWWAITIAAAVLLILGFLLTFGPARYWTPVPVVFLGYFLVSGVIGLVFWKGVRELRDSNPTLHSGDGPASPGARVAAAIGAVGVASALVLLPAGLSDAPANAAPCPDGSNTCGPQPTMGPQPTQGNGGNTTAPQAPNTTVPGYTPPDTPPQQGNGSTPTVQGQVPTMPTGDTPSNGCIFNCGPTQPQQAPQTGQATPPQTGQNPVTTAPNTPATTPQAPTTTPRLRTPTPETTTSTTSSKARDRDDDDQQRSGDEDREKNSGTPYQAAEIAALAGTYRRKKTSDAVRDGQVVSENVTRTLYSNATAVSKPVQLPGPGNGGRIPDPNPGNNDPGKIDPPPSPPRGTPGPGNDGGGDAPIHLMDGEAIGVASNQGNVPGQLVWDQSTGSIYFRDMSPNGLAIASLVTATVNGKPRPLISTVVAGQTVGVLPGLKPGDAVSIRQHTANLNGTTFQLPGQVVPMRTPVQGETDGGPGQWIYVGPSGQPAADYYEEAVTFVQRGWVYRAGGKNFDGYANGALLEAKHGYASIVGSNGEFLPFAKSTIAAIVKEAQTARALGIPFQVYTSTPQAQAAFANAMGVVQGGVHTAIYAPKGRVTF
ncbi:hypothetical protein AXK58_24265 [Tsukamurella tyrosinosolvens]|uniref:Restriction endonuclease fold toxin 5 n=1 Tax=Tsukamurella tyrosinosolvens TaxID=57704 RepID=A0A1H4UMX3_TSUTY|nr:hypothetical protein [Tsukamurella tyrosinosolvens]KXO99072.1 hypothetical protein AXK58_24265 [Tsukamurella tyrosinosolvens]SEC70099.1 hypothetical protein SAMN04489793_2957 [Tsukamurella tyrosinosolvens]